MSWLSDRTGIHLNLGNVAKAALPVVAAAPFLGPLGGLVSKIPGVGAAVGALGGLASKIPGVSAVGNFLKGHGSDVLKAAQGVNAAYLGNKATGMANNALGSVTSSYDQRAPLRVAGVQGMLAAQQRTPRSQAIASTNPYAPKPASDLLSPKG